MTTAELWDSLTPEDKAFIRNIPLQSTTFSAYNIMYNELNGTFKEWINLNLQDHITLK